MMTALAEIEITPDLGALLHGYQNCMIPSSFYLGITTLFNDWPEHILSNFTEKSIDLCI